MSKQNLFKSFTPCEINEDAMDALDFVGDSEDILEAFEAQDPSPTSWRSIGLAKPFGENFLQELDGGFKVMAVQINERILPAKVRDEKVAEKVTAWANEAGRSVTKKEYAQARDEVELELLPKAFIKRMVIPVLFAYLGNDKVPVMLIFTSSPKKMEDAFLCVRNALTQADHSLLKNVELRAMKIATAKEPWRVLTELAKSGATETEDSRGNHLYTDSIAVLVSEDSEDKRKVRVKDREIEAHEIQNLLVQGYVAAELGLIMGDSEESTCWMTVSEKHVYKACAISEKLIEDGDATDAITNAYLTVRQYLNFLALFVDECCGIERCAWAKTEPEQPAVEDDDEL